ncbi:MAG: hypothetical protein M1833_006048, partial [Piccolia ochrophora]
TSSEPREIAELNGWSETTEQLQGARSMSRLLGSSRRIHILGLNGVGLFVAHSLAGLPNRPPISLLAHTITSVTQWERNGRTIEVTTDGLPVSRGNMDIELFRLNDQGSFTDQPTTQGQEQSVSSQAASNDLPINVLVVASRASFVVKTLSAIKHRLHRESTILFLQDGMGVIEAVNAEVFLDIDTRPDYVVGLCLHGISTRRSPFKLVHATLGTTALAALPHYANADSGNATQSMNTTTRYLLRTLTRTPALVAAGYSYLDVFQSQLEKLVETAVIDSLTAVLDCPVHRLLHNSSSSRTMRMLLAEMSLVICSLPELQSASNVRTRFSPARLEKLVVLAAKRRLHLQGHGNASEIDYLNGYIVRRGESLGVQCVVNYTLMQIMKAKWRVAKLEASEGTPWTGSTLWEED